jgi:glycine/sarcosine N-methyltransferase
MTFYQPLTPYYDQIFPTNPKALHFLANTFPQGGTLLDVGAGTGNMALTLLNEGFSVTATEPEETMANQIRQKAKASTTSCGVCSEPTPTTGTLLPTFS